MANDLLAALGIHIQAPWGRVHAGETGTAVGQLFVSDDQISVIPCCGLTDEQRSHLLAAAEYAFFNPPTVDAGWTPVVASDGTQLWRMTIELDDVLHLSRLLSNE